MPVMGSEHRHSLGGLEAFFSALVLALFLFPSNLPGLVDSTSKVEDTVLNRKRIESVQDGFDWADGIITALGGLAPVLVLPSETPLKLNSSRQRRLAFSRHANSFHVTHLFEGLHLCLHKSTVFGIFDVTVDEVGPEIFCLHIGSTQPAENIQIRDQESRAILVDQPLDDERLFAVKVHRKLSPRIVVSVSVLQDGEINKAYFQLLGGDSSN